MGNVAALTQRRTSERRLQAVYEPIAADLAAADAVFAQELASEAPHLRDLIAHLAAYRGKRLRPALLLLTAKACGNVTREHHILAAVVEMIHTATLVHDDVLDEASLRRHAPTVNARFGNQRSVLLGDMLFTHAFYLASTTGSTMACRIIGETTNRVCAGELHQIAEQGNLELDEAAYFDIISGKTAALTGCCAQLGALFSGATEAVVESLSRFGHDLGMAFQIADDVLDLVGNEALTGKSLGTDVEQRKLTLPLIYLLRRGRPDEVRRLQILLDRSALCDLLVQGGAVRLAALDAERFARAARHNLGVLSPSAGRRVLEELTTLVVHRQR
jgi:octaprenyl-diphosphate synthase